MTLQEKWAEYRRRRDILYSVCWDCHPGPCWACRAWAKATAFGLPKPDVYWLESIEETYEIAAKMRETGARFHIEIRGG